MRLPHWEDVRVPVLGGVVLLLALGTVSWLASPKLPGDPVSDGAVTVPPMPMRAPATPTPAATATATPEADPARDAETEAVRPSQAEAPRSPKTTTQADRGLSKVLPPAAAPAPPPAAPTAPTLSAPPATPSPAPPTRTASSTGIRIHLDALAADAVLRGGGSLVAMRSDGLWLASWPDGGVERVADVDHWVRRSHAKVVQDDLIACADPDRDRGRWLRRKLGDGVTGHIVIPAHLYDSWTASQARAPELFVRFTPSTGFVVEGA